MKSLTRNILLGCMALMLATSASAFWRCTISNLKSQSWYSDAFTRKDAFKHAMRLCVANSNVAANCSGTCTQYADPIPGPGPVPPPARDRFTCWIKNGRGETFYASGPTRAKAAGNAAYVCSKNAAYAATCHITTCRRNF